ncbi:MAG: hypothetical protein INR69_19605 [Mucilaginibacter polytrichastri]|nr:hypothetical protein [Mucilaginibacter polytrichastri]
MVHFFACFKLRLMFQERFFMCFKVRLRFFKLRLMFIGRFFIVKEHFFIVKGHFFAFSEHFFAFSGHFFIVKEHFFIVKERFFIVTGHFFIVKEHFLIITKRFSVCPPNFLMRFRVVPKALGLWLWKTFPATGVMMETVCCLMKKRWRKKPDPTVKELLERGCALQQFIRRDGQMPDPDTGGMIHRVCHGSGEPNDGYFPQPFGADGRDNVI